jgi:triacylglycerol lipase
MAKLLSLALVLALVGQAVEAANKYPVVLVHGLMGWNTGEFLNVPYWGTLQGNFPEKLRAEGYTVYTVGVGKLSSDWDRACDLYSQIKGGRVDYGPNHSKVNGHGRYGRNYTGLFPQWGTVVNGKLQKIHLMGHSMGGTTIRMLAQMLNKGVANALTPEDPSAHPLFAGGKDWVHSITTISTPNLGSTLANMITVDPDIIETVAAAAFSLIGALGDTTKSLFDPVMDQWGIANKASGESLKDYFKRVSKSKLFAPGFHDNAGFSLTTKGAAAQAGWVTTLPNVYYYSFVSDATFSWRDPLLRKIALPDLRFASPFTAPLATLMGSRATSAFGFSDDWLRNDGFVNIVSQPSDGVAPVIDFAGKSKRGTWVTFKPLAMDHLGMMGANPLIPVYSLYKAHFALVSDLPSHEQLTQKQRALRADTEEAAIETGEHEAPLSLVLDMFAAQVPLAVEYKEPPKGPQQ